MALFIDGPPSTVDDLAKHDSQLLNVASTEGIDVTGKLELAHEQLRLELKTMLQRLAGWRPELGDIVVTAGWRHQIHNVVATRAVKLWHEYKTLELVYSDAFNSQLNDRYAGKRDQFHEMANWARERLAECGVGMVTDPVPQAAAPTVLPAPGSLPDGTYSVTMAWLNAEGDEGAAAPPASVTIAGSTLQVWPGTAPAAAARWNVYLGPSADSMTLQNPAPLAADQAWLQPGVLSTEGPGPGQGQAPNYVRQIPRLIQRG